MRINELYNNSEFTNAIKNAETTDEITSILTQFGAEELMGKLNTPVFSHGGAELDPETLDTVSGGANNFMAWLGEVLYRIKYGKKASCTYSSINGMSCTPR